MRPSRGDLEGNVLRRNNALDRQLVRVLERVARVLERLAEAQTGETLDVGEAAVLLKTTPRGIYVRRQRGQMPRPVPGPRLVWRKSDLLRGA